MTKQQPLPAQFTDRVLDNLSTAVLVFDTDLRLIYLNRSDNPRLRSEEHTSELQSH